MARIALVSRLIDADTGGGLGAYVAAQAKVLAREHEVTVIADRALQPVAEAAFQDMPSITVLFADCDCEPGGHAFLSSVHYWSSCVLDVLRAHYGEHGPDLIEFPDYHGEGAVTVQAARAGERFLRDTVVTVRVHTTAEICSVLNGGLANDESTRVVCSLERLSLREADRIIYAGGEIKNTMLNYYGADHLAPIVQVRHSCGFAAKPVPPRAIDRSPGEGDRLKVLYLGRFEHRKGVHNLVRAMARATGDLELTMVGGDTDSAPLNTSMRTNLEFGSSVGDRVKILDQIPHDELTAVIDRHDAVIVPSLWECWPYVALEAFARNRPVLATTVGGLAEMVVDGASGMLQSGTSATAIAELLERAYADRSSLRRMSEEHGPYDRFRELVDPEAVLSGYRELIAAGNDRRVSPSVTAGRGNPLVSVVVPYFKMPQFVTETVASVWAQDYPNLEVVIVNDGSFEPEDAVLDRYIGVPGHRVVTQSNSGLGAARNFGITCCRGRYVLPLDADDTIEPGYISRAVELLENDPELSYVCSWTRYFYEDEQGEDREGRCEDDREIGFQPLGLSLPMNEVGNVAGHAGSLFRRSVFGGDMWYCEELASFEDWEFYQALERRGARGCVIPERFYNYRVRGDSMLRTVAPSHLAALEAQKNAQLIYRSVEWGR